MIAFAIAAALVVVEVSTAAPGLAELMDATLPTGRRETSAVWDGQHTYVFGGWDGSLINQIVQYDPADDGAMVMDGKLPTNRESTCAVWDDHNAYIFGGWDGSRINQIVRYNTTTDSVTIMSGKLPTGRSDIPNACIWDGANAYIFGGWDATPASPLNQIVRYNPDSDSVATMAATLPTGRYRVSAVWDSRDLPENGCPGGCAYVFGGLSGSLFLDEIVRYNPTNGTVAVMNATLPSGRQMTSTVWDGQHAYIFGGSNSEAKLDEILRYDPVNDAIALMTAKLPSVRYSTSGVWNGSHAYVFGGWDGVTCCLDDIVRYTPPVPPTAPWNLTATIGSELGATALAWDAPSDDGGEPVTSYRVYRAVLPDGPFELIAEVKTVSYSDSECPTVYLCYYEVRAINLAGVGDASTRTSVPGTLLDQVGGSIT